MRSGARPKGRRTRCRSTLRWGPPGVLHTQTAAPSPRQVGKQVAGELLERIEHSVREVETRVTSPLVDFMFQNLNTGGSNIAGVLWKNADQIRDLARDHIDVTSRVPSITATDPVGVVRGLGDDLDNPVLQAFRALVVDGALEQIANLASQYDAVDRLFHQYQRNQDVTLRLNAKRPGLGDLLDPLLQLSNSPQMSSIRSRNRPFVSPVRSFLMSRLAMLTTHEFSYDFPTFFVYRNHFRTVSLGMNPALLFTMLQGTWNPWDSLAAGLLHEADHVVLRHLTGRDLHESAFGTKIENLDPPTQAVARHCTQMAQEGFINYRITVTGFNRFSSLADLPEIKPGDFDWDRLEEDARVKLVWPRDLYFLDGVPKEQNDWNRWEDVPGHPGLVRPDPNAVLFAPPPLHELVHGDRRVALVNPVNPYLLYLMYREHVNLPVSFEEFAKTDVAMYRFLFPVFQQLMQEEQGQQAGQPSSQGTPQPGRACGHCGTQDQQGEEGEAQGPSELDELQERLLEETLDSAQSGNQEAEKELTDLHDRFGPQEGSKVWGTVPVGAIRDTDQPVPVSERSPAMWRALLSQVCGSMLEPEEVLQFPRRQVGARPFWLRAGKDMPITSGLRDQAKPSALVFLDASGSIDTATLKDLQRTIPVAVPEGEIHWFTFDTQVYELDPQNPQIRGGGGTSFSCIMEKVDEFEKENGDKPVDVVIVVTDGYAGHIEPTDRDRWIWLLVQGGDDWMAGKGMRVIKLDS